MKRFRKCISFHYVIGFVTTCLLAAGIFFPDNLATAYASLHSPLACPSVVELGDVPAGKATARTISLLNTHLSNVELQSVNTSCGCTVAKATTKSIPPLGRGTLKITVEPGNLGEGGETIELKTNYGAQQIRIRYNAV
jgi:hypothetical protein